MDYVETLKTELVGKLKRNPSYSQRAFAKQLNLSAGELSEILNHKRPLSLKKAISISEKLQFTKVESEHFLSSVQGREEFKNLEPQQLSLDLFSILSDYIPFAILNLHDCQGFQWGPEWIAQKLGVHTYEVELAIKRLKRVGLIQGHKGQYKVNQQYVISPSDVPSRAIRDYHHTMLTKAISSLEEQPFQNRDVTGVGMAISHDSIPKIKQEISDFLDQLATKYSKGYKNRVYQLEVALFELTKDSTDGKN
jgi:uncharacterized protein (TIGR02147 family)